MIRTTLLFVSLLAIWASPVFCMNSAFAPSQTTTQDSQGTLISAIFHILLIVYRSAEHFIDQGKTPGN